MIKCTVNKFCIFIKSFSFRTILIIFWYVREIDDGLIKAITEPNIPSNKIWCMIYNNSLKEVLQHLFYENKGDFWMKLRKSTLKLMNPCESKGMLSHFMIKLTTQSNRTLKINNYLMKLNRLKMGLSGVCDQMRKARVCHFLFLRR